jgi:flagellar motor switch protein FliN
MSIPASESSPKSTESDSSHVLRIPVTIDVILGSAKMTIEEVFALAKGSVVRLDRRVAEQVDINVNGRTICKGTVVVVDQLTNQLGVSVAEVF